MTIRNFPFSHAAILRQTRRDIIEEHDGGIDTGIPVTAIEAWRVNIDHGVEYTGAPAVKPDAPATTINPPALNAAERRILRSMNAPAAVFRRRSALKKFLMLTDGGKVRDILGEGYKTNLPIPGMPDAKIKVAYRSPHVEAGRLNCSALTRGCKAACLVSTGQMIYDQSRRARIKKSMLRHHFPFAYMATYARELQRFERYCAKRGLIPVVRDGGTDENGDGAGWARMFPGIRFYDYRKDSLAEVIRKAGGSLPSNYHVTFSLSERAWSWREAQRYLDAGFGAAVVVAAEGSTRKADAKRAQARILERGHLHGIPVVNGDEHDYRPGDLTGRLAVLYAKGKALHDTTGFVHRV